MVTCCAGCVEREAYIRSLVRALDAAAKRVDEAETEVIVIDMETMDDVQREERA